MDNLILSFNVVLPLCLSILLGYFLLRIGMIDSSVQKSLNRLCFKVFLPVYVFNNIYTTNISTAFHLPLILLSVLGIFFLFLSMMLLIPRLEPVPAKCGVIIQAIFRSNYALFGLPVAASLCGEQNLGPTTLLLGIVVPLFNVFAVICLESFRGGKPSIRKILRGIAVNPLIIASALGIAANLLNIHLPSGVHKCITDLGRIATPLSLVVLGAGFSFRIIGGYARQLAIAISGKLVFSPLIMLTIGVIMGLRNELLVPVLVVFGSPVAVSSYTMAEQMDADGQLAASIVVLSTILSIFTIFLFTFALKQLALV